MPAPRQVWDDIADFNNYLDFVDGLTRWEPVSEKTSGLGARFRMLLHVGSADVGGVIEVVEWHEPTDLAFSSVTGVDQRGRWRVREGREGGTRVEFRWSYGVAGAGIAGHDRRAGLGAPAAPQPQGHARAAQGRGRAHPGRRGRLSSRPVLLVGAQPPAGDAALARRLHGLLVLCGVDFAHHA